MHSTARSRQFVHGKDPLPRSHTVLVRQTRLQDTLLRHTSNFLYPALIACLCSPALSRYLDTSDSAFHGPGSCKLSVKKLYYSVLGLERAIELVSCLMS